MNKKIFLLLALVAALTLVFVACETNEPADTTVATDEITDAPTEDVTDDATETPTEDVTDDATEEVTTETPTEEVTTEAPTEPVIVAPSYHSSVDHVNGKGPNGAPNYAGRGGSTVNENPDTDVIDFVADGHTVGSDYIVSIGGWLGMNGGVAKYVWTVDGETWHDVAAGGIDGEPVANHYAGIGLTDALKNGMFNGANMLKANLKAYAGQTVSVTFGGVSETNGAIAAFVTLKDVSVPAIEPYKVDLSEQPTIGTFSGYRTNEENPGTQFQHVNAKNDNEIANNGGAFVFFDKDSVLTLNNMDLSGYKTVTLRVATGTQDSLILSFNVNGEEIADAEMRVIGENHKIHEVTFDLSSVDATDATVTLTVNSVGICPGVITEIVFLP